MNSLATPPYDANDIFDNAAPSPALNALNNPPPASMRAVLASTWGVLDQVRSNNYYILSLVANQ